MESTGKAGLGVARAASPILVCKSVTAVYQAHFSLQAPTITEQPCSLQQQPGGVITSPTVASCDCLLGHTCAAAPLQLSRATSTH
jgi:hypothetical protein